jgi:hypothetical protein
LAKLSSSTSTAPLPMRTSRTKLLIFPKTSLLSRHAVGLSVVFRWRFCTAVCFAIPFISYNTLASTGVLPSVALFIPAYSLPQESPRAPTRTGPFTAAGVATLGRDRVRGWS